MSKLRTHYDNLQVSRTAFDAVIRAAYRSLSQLHHPDKHPNNRATAERRMKVINQAYQVLSDPETRRQHDEWISRMEIDQVDDGSGVTQEDLHEHSVDQIIVYQKLRSKLFGLLVGLGFSIGSLLLGIDLLNQEYPSLVRQAGGFFLLLVNVPFFGLVAFISLKRIVNRVPSLVVSEDGIRINGVIRATLPWSDIREVNTIEYSGNRFLVVIPRDANEIYERQTPLGKILMGLNGLFMGVLGGIYLSERELDRPLDTMLNEIMARSPKGRGA